MSARYHTTIIFMIAITITITVSSQDDICPKIVDAAIELITDVCANTGRNQACYGNLSLEAQPQPHVRSLEFDSPGDIEDVAKIQVLRTTPMDTTVPEWGIAMLRLQANLPDTIPGQSVTMLLFGEAEIKNQVTTVKPIRVTVTKQINARSGPHTSYDVIGNLSPDSPGMADGRTEDGEWFRVQTCSSGPLSCWVYAPLVTLRGDASTLPVIDPNKGSFTPLQAFILKSGIGDAQCADAPDSGILIQTPQGIGTINLRINQVDIALGSTAYLTAQPSRTLNIYVIEGRAIVTAEGTTQIVYAGSVSTVPLDEESTASGTPSEPEPYELSDLQALPVEVLDDPIEIAAPLTGETLAAISGECTVTAATTVNLRSGPGTVYDRVGILKEGELQTPIGQADGLDGLIWWQLSLESWARSDTVTVTESCENLPIVTNLPPVPLPPVLASSGGSSSPESGAGGASNHIPLTWCDYTLGGTWPNPVLPNVRVYMNWGGNEEWALFGLNGGIVSSLTVNGVDQGPPHQILYQPGTNDCNYDTTRNWDLNLPPGTYTVVGTNQVTTTANRRECTTGEIIYTPVSAGHSATCTFTVP